jgi:hypothetical protein
LFEKVFKQYDEMKQEQKGGTLFFIIMMNILLSHTEEAALALNGWVRNFRLTNLQGKNVDKAVSLLRGAMKRLKSINKDPEDILRVLISVMQTSSVDDFNATFHNLEKVCLILNALHRSGERLITQAGELFGLAETTYGSFVEAGTWTGASTTGSESTCVAQDGATAPPKVKVCWNCGGNHLLHECKTQRNEQKIPAERDKLLATQGQGGGGCRGRGGQVEEAAEAVAVVVDEVAKEVAEGEIEPHPSGGALTQVRTITM